MMALKLKEAQKIIEWNSQAVLASFEFQPKQDNLFLQ